MQSTPIKQKAESETLAIMRERVLLPGQAWHAYENQDLGSTMVGHLKFVKCGESCTLETPPSHYPHDSVSQGHMYRHIGTVDLTTGDVVAATTLPLSAPPVSGATDAQSRW